MKVKIINQSFIYEGDVVKLVLVRYDIVCPKFYISGDYRFTFDEYLENVTPTQLGQLLIRKLNVDFEEEVTALDAPKLP